MSSPAATDALERDLQRGRAEILEPGPVTSQGGTDGGGPLPPPSSPPDDDRGGGDSWKPRKRPLARLIVFVVLGILSFTIGWWIGKAGEVFIRGLEAR